MGTLSRLPAPTVSTATNVRPVPTSRSRCCGSTRNGSTVSNLCPVIAATFCVPTTRPVTFARNMRCSRFLEPARDRGEDFLVVRKAVLVELAENNVAVDRHVEDAAAARFSFRLHRVAVGLANCVPQTGGETLVAPGRAVRDIHFHRLPLGFQKSLRLPGDD